MRLVAEAPAANGRTYIVADPRAYSGREIYDAIRAASAAGAVSPGPTFRWSVPAGVLRAAGRLNGRLGEIVDRLIGSACYSPARIERELGWRAKVGLAEGVRDMLR
jgi:nucleoside-diphosphate-sugar epimerase